MLELVLIAETAAGGYIEATDTLIDGVDACQEEVREGAGVVLNGGAVALVEDRGDTFDHGDFVADVVHVRNFQADLTAGLRATRLQRCAAGKDSDDVGSPGTEDQIDSVLETRTKGQQNDDGGNAPGHAKHGEGGAAAVVAHGAVGFAEQIARHKSTPCAMLQSVPASLLCARDRVRR